MLDQIRDRRPSQCRVTNLRYTLIQNDMAKAKSGFLKKLVFRGGIVLFVIFVGIQFVPVEGVGVNPTDERFQVEASPEVKAILEKACDDCHTNETRWPWYSRIAPVSWLVARDVVKGRARFNMSEWGDYDAEEKAIDKETAWEEIEEGEMPPWFYYPTHPDALLSDAELATLRAWLMEPVPEEDDEDASDDDDADEEDA